jgi:hypothetical protein
MKHTCLKILLLFMVIAFIGGAMSALVYAGGHQNCSCCAANKCHQSAKCHSTTKACICGFQITQAVNQKAAISIGLVPVGYLAHNLNFSYLYLSTKDIFHPPKA